MNYILNNAICRKSWQRSDRCL